MMLSGRTSGSVVASIVSRNGGGAVWLGGIRTLKSPAYRRAMMKKSMAAAQHGPTMLDVKTMPVSMAEMENESLVSLAAMKNHEARIEVLKRHIMNVDRVSYETASKTFEEIQKCNHEGMWLPVTPYLFGMTVATVGGLASLPLCFYFPIVENFNEQFVTFDVPEAKDLETPLEVGSWAWNWMVCHIDIYDERYWSV